MKKCLLALAIVAGFALSGQSWTYNGLIEYPNWYGQSLSVAQAGTDGIVNAHSKNAKIRLIFGNEEVIVILEENSASQDLISLLPLTLTFEDYNGTEKISSLPRKLKTQGAPSSCDPTVGSFTYYAPWGNLAIFYHDFRHSNGLVPLGRIESGMEKLARMSGNFSMRLEKMD